MRVLPIDILVGLAVTGAWLLMVDLVEPGAALFAGLAGLVVHLVTWMFAWLVLLRPPTEALASGGAARLESWPRRLAGSYGISWAAHVGVMFAVAAHHSPALFGPVE